MAEEPQNLRTSYSHAEIRRKQLDTFYNSNTATFQEHLLSAISLYEQALRQADSISLFSPNESLEDISTHDLQYLLINYYLAELIQRRNAGDRKLMLQRASERYTQYLRLLESYEILSASDAKLFERYQEAPTTFSTASTSDPAARRDIKIKRFKEEGELKRNLEYLQRNPAAIQNDDEVYRGLQLAQLALCAHQTFQTLESIAQELHILSLAPPTPAPQQDGTEPDGRERGGRNGDGYSERLDTSGMSAGLSGPLLDKSGRPMRPFTLLGSRQKLQSEVFRPDHSLPSMTIDEYLEEEKRRGGMIDGGGPQSGMQPEPNEDDFDKADEETMKARAWDEFVEANPKGSGNTLNRG